MFSVSLRHLWISTLCLGLDIQRNFLTYNIPRSRSESDILKVMPVNNDFLYFKLIILHIFITTLINPSYCSKIFGTRRSRSENIINLNTHSFNHNLAFQTFRFFCPIDSQKHFRIYCEILPKYEDSMVYAFNLKMNFGITVLLFQSIFIS